MHDAETQLAELKRVLIETSGKIEKLPDRMVGLLRRAPVAGMGTGTPNYFCCPRLRRVYYKNRTEWLYGWSRIKGIL